MHDGTSSSHKTMILTKLKIYCIMFMPCDVLDLNAKNEKFQFPENLCSFSAVLINTYSSPQSTGSSIHCLVRLFSTCFFCLLRAFVHFWLALPPRPPLSLLPHCLPVHIVESTVFPSSVSREPKFLIDFVSI